jgi:hypothetical protein
MSISPCTTNEVAQNIHSPQPTLFNSRPTQIGLHYSLGLQTLREASLSLRLQRRQEKSVLLPARPPFFLASVGLVGLGGEGNGWIFARLCRLGPFRSRVWCPGGARKVEAACLQWNNILQALFHLAVTCSGVGGELVRWESFGSRDRVGASDLDGSCLGVPAPYLLSAEMASASAWSPSMMTSSVVTTADSRYLLLILCAVGMELVLLPWL